MNIIEIVAASEGELERSPCAWGNVVVGHACYCHHEDGPRKCGLYWGGVEEMQTCEMFEPAPEEDS